MSREVSVPELGDAGEVEVIELCVEPGAAVEEGDSLIVIESDKASMDVPAPFAGTVESFSVSVGDMISEGHVIAKLGGDAPESPSSGPEDDVSSGEIEATQETEPAETASSADEKPAPSQTAPAQSLDVNLPDIGEATDVAVIEIAVSAGDEVAEGDLLVVVESDKASMEVPSPFAGTVERVAVSDGDSVSEGSLLVVLKAEGASEPGAREEAPQEAPEAPSTSDSQKERSQASADPLPALAPSSDGSVYAGPATRRLARELGVELSAVQASGSRGRITKDDVKAFVKSTLSSGGAPAASSGAGIPAIPAVDFSRFGEIETVEMSRLRKRGAENLHRSWLNVVHVTQHDEADFTEADAFRKSLKAEAEKRGSKITPLAFIIKAVVASLKAFPQFNASLTPDVDGLILKRYYNIGMAVDTPDGLVVPVIKDADKKGIWELCDDILELSGKARDGKLGIDDLSGGSFSVSSLGPIGGTGFTPIVNAPEVAILGVSKLTKKPVWNGQEFVPRDMLPVSLSYDHRAINGAEAGRFVSHLCEGLSDIRRVLL